MITTIKQINVHHHLTLLPFCESFFFFCVFMVRATKIYPFSKNSLNQSILTVVLMFVRSQDFFIILICCLESIDLQLPISFHPS